MTTEEKQLRGEREAEMPNFTPPVYDQEFFDAMDEIARIDAGIDYASWWENDEDL